MRLWQNNVDLDPIATSVIGCGCAVCQPDREAWSRSFRQNEPEIKRRFMAELASRQERSIRICAKLIAFRDSIVAETFLRESIATEAARST